MARRKQAPQKTQDKIFGIQSIYGTKKTAEKLGVSASTVRRWKSGKSTPKPEHLHIINRVYGSNTRRIIPERVQQERTQYERRSIAHQVKEWHIPIYPDYIEVLHEKTPIETTDGTFDNLIELSEQGYEYAYIGHKNEPELFGQFILHGARLGDTETGRLHLVVNLTAHNSNKNRTHDNYEVYLIKDFSIAKSIERLIGFDRNSDLETNQEVLAAYAQNALSKNIDRNAVITGILGYYYEE